ncbi:hypothetical protein CBS101457_003413 [Exobasidium rhododendri]|nr:hypothetical protein CBS101457_003413 [Exobasidium rhododendri]
MPRSGGRSGGGRSAPSGSRGSHSMASHPKQQTQPANVPHNNGQPPMQQQQQGRAPGLFGQMASTAAGVAVGSSLGHAMSGFFGGGGSSEPAPEAQSTNSPAQWNEQGFNNNNSQSGSVSCEVQSKDFLRCLDATNNSMDSCAFYLDQLKACQAQARNY